jgi:hypothetical protein
MDCAWGRQSRCAPRSFPWSVRASGPSFSRRSALKNHALDLISVVASRQSLRAGLGSPGRWKAPVTCAGGGAGANGGTKRRPAVCQARGCGDSTVWGREAGSPVRKRAPAHTPSSRLPFTKQQRTIAAADEILVDFPFATVGPRPDRGSDPAVLNALGIRS